MGTNKTEKMKLETRKYCRILDAQIKLQNKIEKLPIHGENWKKNKDKVEVLEKKYEEYKLKLNNLTQLIKKEEFETHLENRMCCTWEEFKI